MSTKRTLLAVVATATLTGSVTAAAVDDRESTAAIPARGPAAAAPASPLRSIELGVGPAVLTIGDELTVRAKLRGHDEDDRFMVYLSGFDGCHADLPTAQDRGEQLHDVDSLSYEVGDDLRGTVELTGTVTEDSTAGPGLYRVCGAVFQDGSSQVLAAGSAPFEAREAPAR